MTKCDATGKVCHPTRDAAEAAPQPTPDAHAYFCDTGCDSWHLTSQPVRGYAPDRRRARQAHNRRRHGRTRP